MSWISDNYEKVAIGGAAVVAIAFASIIFKNKNLVEEIAVLPSVKPIDETDVAGLPGISAAKVSLANSHIITPPIEDGRELNLFTGVQLFTKKDDLENPINLLQSPPVHEKMDNTWWLKYGIDPGNSDAPEQDPDNDGFTNREECIAGTIPIDPKSHPDPIVKLMVKGVKTTQVHVRPQDFGGGKFTFRLQTKGGATVNRMGANPIEPGADIIFQGDLMKNRFKFIGVANKQMKKNGINQNVREWIIEDKQPNKKGQFRVDRRGNPGVLDSTVELDLDALKQKGQTFKVQENTTFSLPFNADAKEKPYLLKKVDLANKQVEIEYVDKSGSKKSDKLGYK